MPLWPPFSRIYRRGVSRHQIRRCPPMSRLRHVLLVLGLTLHFGCSRSAEPIGVRNETPPPNTPLAGQAAAPTDSPTPSAADRATSADAKGELPESGKQQSSRLIYRADFAVASAD